MSTQTFVVGRAPGAIPGLGHAWQLLRHPLQFMSSLGKYGDLVKIRIGPISAYVPCHPDLLREVLLNDRVFDKGGVVYERAREVGGNGVSTCPFSEHRRQRRLMQPAFHRAQVQRYVPAMHAEIHTTSGTWRDGMVIDAFPELVGMALRTLIRTLFSRPVEEKVVHNLARTFEELLSQQFRQLFLPKIVRRLPTPDNRRYRSNLKLRHDTVQNLVDDYRKNDPSRDDLLSILLASHDEDGGRLDDTEIHDQILTMLAAGTDTVATTLTWVFYLLSQHSDIEKRLYEEIDTVLDGNAPQWDDLTRLSLTDRIVTEALRLYPPVWLVTRRTTADITLAGVRLTKGSTVIFSPPSVQRSTPPFSQEAEFDPDRWLPERTSPQARQAFVAFGAGARKCIGDLYGRTECILTLATILSQWRVTVEPGYNIRPLALAIVYRPRRLHLRLTAHNR